jgi:hypothetical protein
MIRFIACYMPIIFLTMDWLPERNFGTDLGWTRSCSWNFCRGWQTIVPILWWRRTMLMCRVSPQFINALQWWGWLHMVPPAVYRTSTFVWQNLRTLSQCISFARQWWQWLGQTIWEAQWSRNSSYHGTLFCYKIFWDAWENRLHEFVMKELSICLARYVQRA